MAAFAMVIHSKSIILVTMSRSIHQLRFPALLFSTLLRSLIHKFLAAWFKALTTS